MGSSRRFTAVLAAWVVALFAGLAGLGEALRQPDLAATRIVAALAVVGALAGMLRHIDRTNRTIARLVEALRHRDLAVRVDERGGAGFGALGHALNDLLRDLARERAGAADELRFWEALVDDLPTAVLTVDARGAVSLANKAARRLFDDHVGTATTDFATYGEAFAVWLAQPGPAAQTVVTLALGAGPQRAVLRAGTVARASAAVRVVAVEPVQAALDRAEVGAQTDLVRVLTHEILNSLTPVTSLAGTAAVLLGEEEPDLAEARLAVLTLARRAEGMRRFVESYRQVAELPRPRRRRFAAAPFAAELARLFGVEWIEHRLAVEVDPGLELDADPDLLAQALINLLRNAAQASAAAARPSVTLSLRSRAGGGAVLSVADNGPGISPELRHEVFLPFFTTRRDGSGVGLNLVRQIAVAHGWAVDAGEAPGGGALLRIVTD